MDIAEGIVDLTKEFVRPAEAVFSAWAMEEAQRIWGDPGQGWDMAFDQFSFAVGKTDICRFGPTGGQQYVNENHYLAIEAGKQIIYSTTLRSEGRLGFAGTVVVTFWNTAKGTRMRLIEQGLYFDGRDDVASHRDGWEAMLSALEDYLHSQ